MFIEVSVQFSCIDDCYLIVPFLGLVKFISGSQNLKSASLMEGFFCEPSVWGSLQHYVLNKCRDVVKIEIIKTF